MSSYRELMKGDGGGVRERNTAMALGSGLKAVCEAITIACRPPSFRAAVVPVLVNVGVGSFLLFLLWYGWPALNPVAPDAVEWYLWVYQTIRYWVMKLGMLVAFSLSLIALSIILTEPLCGFLGVLDRLVILQQRELAPEMPMVPAPLLVSVLRACQVVLVGLCIQLPAQFMVGVSFVASLIPVVGWLLATVLTVGSVCLAGLAMAWNLLDYPFSLAGCGVRARVRWVVNNFPAVLEIGIPLALFSFLLTPFVLPVGVIASSRLFFRTRPEAEN